MFTQIFILLCGLFLVVFCANYLVEGSSVIARKLGISEFVIGMFIVGFGTSLPELVVSMIGAFNGNADIAIGNVIGSNVFNTSLILGLSVMIVPMLVSEVNKRRDIPFLMMATTFFIAIGVTGNGISRLDGLAMLLIFALYIFYLFKTDGEKEPEPENITPSGLLFQTFYGSIGIVIGSIIGLIVGGNLFVDSARNIGAMTGLSDKVIGVTILAFGTSLPELATCIAAVSKKHTQIALGNIIGSNVFNILMIAGLASMVRPLGFTNINVVDLCALAISTLILYVSQHTAHQGKLTRLDGSCMLITFAAYIVMLFTL